LGKQGKRVREWAAYLIDDAFGKRRSIVEWFSEELGTTARTSAKNSTRKP
jgi:hypothetical protein